MTGVIPTNKRLSQTVLLWCKQFGARVCVQVSIWNKIIWYTFKIISTTNRNCVIAPVDWVCIKVKSDLFLYLIAKQNLGTSNPWSCAPFTSVWISCQKLGTWGCVSETPNQRSQPAHWLTPSNLLRAKFYRHLWYCLNFDSKYAFQTKANCLIFFESCTIYR